MIKNAAKKTVHMTVSAKSGQGAESKRQEPAEGAIISISFLIHLSRSIPLFFKNFKDLYKVFPTRMLKFREF